MNSGFSMALEVQQTKSSYYLPNFLPILFTVPPTFYIPLSFLLFIIIAIHFFPRNAAEDKIKTSGRSNLQLISSLGDTSITDRLPPHHPIRTAKTEIPSCSLLPSSSLPPPSLLPPSPHLSSNQLPFSSSLNPEPLDLLDVILSRREGGEGRREGGGGGGRREGRGEEGGRGRGGGGGRGGEDGIKDWEVEKVFENILMSSLDTMNLVFLWCLSFWIYLRVGFDVRVMIGIGFGIYLLVIFRMVFFYRNTPKRLKDLKNKCKFEIYEKLLYLILYIGISIYVYFGSFPLTYIALPVPMINIILWCSFNVKEKKSYLYTTSIIRLYIFIQLLHISLKLDRIIMWEWETIFWSSWMVFLLVFLYILGLFVLILYNIYLTPQKESRFNLIKGFIWCMNILLMIDFNIFYISMGLIGFFEKNKEILISGLFIMCIWLPITFIITMIFQKSIISFISSINSDSYFVQDYDPENPLELESEQKKFKFKRLTNLPSGIPHFLLQFSASYFQFIDAKKEIRDKKDSMVYSSSSIQSKIKIKKKNKKNIKGEERKFSQLDDFENSKKSGHALNCQTKSSIVSIKEKSENNFDKTPSEESSKTCVICFENQPDAVLMNCGHGGICHKCAVELWKKTDGLCHLCRKKIDKILQIEMNKKSTRDNLLSVVAVTERKDR